MANWKVLVIALMLGALAGYGYLQNEHIGPINGDNQPKSDESANGPLTSPLVGKPAPAFSIPASRWVNSSQAINLKGLRAHPVVLEFWEAGSKPSDAMVPKIRDLYKKWRPYGVQFVAIHSSDKSAGHGAGVSPAVTRKVAELKVPYPVGDDADGKIFTKTYQGQTLPTIYLLDGKGTVRYCQVGDNGFDQMIGFLPELFPGKSPLLGRVAPDIAIPASLCVNTRKPISLKALRGKPVFLEFWRAGCPHCLAAAPLLINLYQKWHPRGVEFVSIHSSRNVGDPLEGNFSAVSKKVSELKIPYPVGFDSTGGKLFMDRYLGNRYPSIYLLDEHGVVRSYEQGDKEIDKLTAMLPKMVH